MRALLPILVTVLSGCYSYVAVGAGEAPAPAEGTEVQLAFTAPRDVVLQDVTVHGITEMQGRVVFARADSVALTVVRLWGQEGRTYEAEGVGVSVGAQDIAAVRAKRMSPARSGLAIGAGGAGVVAMIFGVRQLVGAGGGGSPPKPLP